jgi:hypothetical protein
MNAATTMRHAHWWGKLPAYDLQEPEVLQRRTATGQPDAKEIHPFLQGQRKPAADQIDELPITFDREDVESRLATAWPWQLALHTMFFRALRGPPGRAGGSQHVCW